MDELTTTKDMYNATISEKYYDTFGAVTYIACVVIWYSIGIIGILITKFKNEIGKKKKKQTLAQMQTPYIKSSFASTCEHLRTLEVLSNEHFRTKAWDIYFGRRFSLRHWSNEKLVLKNIHAKTTSMYVDMTMPAFFERRNDEFNEMIPLRSELCAIAEDPFICDTNMNIDEDDVFINSDEDKSRYEKWYCDDLSKSKYVKDTHFTFPKLQKFFKRNLNKRERSNSAHQGETSIYNSRFKQSCSLRSCSYSHLNNDLKQKS